MRLPPQRLGLSVIALTVAHCARGAVVPPERPAPYRAIAPGPSADAIVRPARLVPDVGPSVPGLLERLPDGSRRIFAAGIRIVDHPDGSIERADETLPAGMPRVLGLPARLGGGMLLLSQADDSTKVWRTDDWLGRAIPFVRFRPSSGEIVAGLDRLYVRTPSRDWTGLDPRTGVLMPLGPLPVETRIDAMGFADAWRGVVVTDLRGPMATFDAGHSWHRIPLAGGNVAAIRADDGNLVLETAALRVTLGPRGEITAAAAAAPVTAAKPAEHDEPLPPFTRRLGSRPLRAVVEDGWPAASTHATEAVFARAGAVYRVRLSDGKVTGERAGLFPEAFSTCHAIALGVSFGFVCGGSGAGTALYAFEPPLGVREIMRFSGARSVVSSGNGGVVVRGPCLRDAPATGEIDATPVGSALRLHVARGRAITFCALAPSGREREIVLRPEWAGSAAPTVRAVVLRDDTVALVVAASREHGASRLLLLRPGSTAPSFIGLAAPSPASWLDEAQWLDGLYEPSAGTIAGWVQIGEEVAGVRVSMDGVVTLGKNRWKVETAIWSGPFAVDWRPAARQGLETTDGGFTAHRIELPPTDVLRQRRDVAACSPVGCASGSWIRVGWGPDDTDRGAPDPVEPGALAATPRNPLALRCAPTGRVAGPAPAHAAASAPVRRPSRAKASVPDKPVTSFRAFRGAAPPATAADDAIVEAETAVSQSVPSQSVQAHVYAWGSRGADWSRVGRWLAKFDDPFDLSGVRASAASAPPWSDETALADALGAGPSAAAAVRALLDPSGTAALLYTHRSGNRSELFGLAPTEPIVTFRGTDESSLPEPLSVVRVGSVFYFTSGRPAAAVGTALYRVEAGWARALTRLPRVARADDATLVRRVFGGGLGILVLGAPAPERSARDLYVLPLDPDTGEIAEPIRLLAADLGGRLPRRCRGDEDGWWILVAPTAQPSIDIGGSPPASVGRVELRLRVEPAEACVEAIAARADPIPVSAPAASADPSAVPMLLTDASGRRWEYACRP